MWTATADAVIIIKGYWDILANSDEGHSGIKLIERNFCCCDLSNIAVFKFADYSNSEF